MIFIANKLLHKIKMIDNTYTVPIFMVKQMVQRQNSYRDFAMQCAQRVGVSKALLQQKSARITVHQFSEFYRLLVLGLDDETPGFFSRPLRGGTLKFLCLSMLGSTDLSIALHRFCWFFKIIFDDLSFVLQKHDDFVKVRIIEKKDLGAERILILEIMLLLIQGIASWMVDRKIQLLGVNLPYKKPHHYAEYINMYTAKANFYQQDCALIFDPDDMHLTVRQDHKSLSAFLRKAPRDWIRPAVSTHLYTHKVRDLLSSNLNLSLSEVCENMHLSPRTLARRLDQENTQFQQIKNDLRRDIAISKLLRSNEPIAKIGSDLGFDDPAVFNRAFKLWLGVAPGMYRKART